MAGGVKMKREKKGATRGGRGGRRVGAGRPKGATKGRANAATLEKQFLAAETATDFLRLVKAVGAQTVAGRIGIRVSATAQGWARIALGAVKVATYQRASEDLAQKAIVITEEEEAWLKAMRAVGGTKPLAPGERVAPPDRSPVEIEIAGLAERLESWRASEAQLDAATEARAKIPDPKDDDEKAIALAAEAEKAVDAAQRLVAGARSWFASLVKQLLPAHCVTPGGKSGAA